MYLAMLILITFASTADSFIIGFNYGLKKVRINYVSNFYISLVTCFGTFFSMHFGKLLSNFVSVHAANTIGGIVLIILGVYMAKNTLYPNENKMQELTNDPSMIDEDQSMIIELREALLIGVLLSINNIGMGVGAGIMGMPIFITSFICGIASFIFVKGGSLLGSLFHTGKLSKFMEILSAVFVLLLGILGFFN